MRRLDETSASCAARTVWNDHAARHADYTRVPIAHFAPHTFAATRYDVLHTRCPRTWCKRLLMGRLRSATPHLPHGTRTLPRCTGKSTPPHHPRGDTTTSPANFTSPARWARLTALHTHPPHHGYRARLTYNTIQHISAATGWLCGSSYSLLQPSSTSAAEHSRYRDRYPGGTGAV